MLTTDKLKTQKGTLFVVRDDLLEGGTKQRAGLPFLSSFQEEGFDEFVYASPFSGYAQIALSICANKCQTKSTIFCQSDPLKGTMSHFTKIASKYSKVVLCKSLEEAENLAFEYCLNKKSAFKIPLGFDHPLFVDFLKEDLNIQWGILRERFEIKKFWVPVGSGTLAKTFREILPDSIKMFCVDVRVLPESDRRLAFVRQMKNVEYLTAAEMFCDPSVFLPPIPSNLFYDAKLWRFLNLMAGDKDLWWNVAA